MYLLCVPSLVPLELGFLCGFFSAVPKERPATGSSPSVLLLLLIRVTLDSVELKDSADLKDVFLTGAPFSLELSKQGTKTFAAVFPRVKRLPTWLPFTH